MKKLLLLGLLCPLFASAGILEDALLCEKEFTPEQIKTALVENGNVRRVMGSNRQEFILKKPISYNGLEFNKGAFVNHVGDDESYTRFYVFASTEQVTQFVNLITKKEYKGLISLLHVGEDYFLLECKHIQ